MTALTQQEVIPWRDPVALARFYAAEEAKRAAALRRIREQPELLPALFELYAADPAAFISDWGVTSDPRNPEVGLPPDVPFILFDRQHEMVKWILQRWRSKENGIVEKTRDVGASYLVIALACTLCLFNRGLVIGFGSRKEELVDKLDDPKSLFWKARAFMISLPVEFQRGWDIDTSAPHMRVIFPSTQSFITGEAGDNIGRGGRASIYFVDEAAFLERPLLIDAALSRTTDCRIDVSTPNGMGNSFAARRHSGNTPVFSLHWRQDPRRDDSWYAEQCRKIDNGLVIARELDISYTDSADGVLIPSEWIQAAIGAHIKLGIEVNGWRIAGFDVADSGIDKNAIAVRHGILLQYLEQWSGRGSDIFATVERAMGICDQHAVEFLDFDSDGVGAGVKGDARVVNERRAEAGKDRIRVFPYRGSGPPAKPDGELVKSRKNKDYFANLKAMSWWSLRLRFQATHRAVVGKIPCEDPDDLICIDPNLPELVSLCLELSQPTWSCNSVGKILINKSPEGTRSPNLADATCIAFNPGSSSAGVRAWAALGAASRSLQSVVAAGRS